MCLGLKPSDPNYYDIRFGLKNIISKVYTDDLLPADKNRSPKKHICAEKLSIIS